MPLINDGVYTSDKLKWRITNNPDGTVKVELVIPLGSGVILIQANGSVTKELVK